MDAASVRTRDGVDLAGCHWPAAGDPRAAVVLVHGFCASKDDANVVLLAERLCGDGFDVVCFDGRGHGASDGLCTLGDHERHDVAAAVSRARPAGVPVIVVGASMGAIAALRYAVDDPALAGVVVVSSPARWRLPRTLRAVAATALTQTRPGRWVAARRLHVRLAPRWTRAEPPVALVARLRVPLAVVHGDTDRFIPVAEAAVLAASAGSAHRFTVVPGMGHAFDPAGHSAIVESVEWTLSHPAPAVLSASSPIQGVGAYKNV